MIIKSRYGDFLPKPDNLIYNALALRRIMRNL
jgi:hypothetical protein